MKTKVLLFVGVLTLLFSCDISSLYERYEPIAKNKWHKDSLITFSVDIKDTISSNDLFINIRNTTKYPNSNLWLFVKITDPTGKTIGDTIEYTLADHRGKWVGKGLGDLHDNQFLYKSNVSFAHSGTYQFSIQHGMRTTVLKGISDVGLRIKNR